MPDCRTTRSGKPFFWVFKKEILPQCVTEGFPFTLSLTFRQAAFYEKYVKTQFDDKFDDFDDSDD